MSKASITQTSGTANIPVFARIFPDGTAVYDASGEPVQHIALTQADSNGSWTLKLEETDTMSPSGVAWEITEGSASPVYIQFGSGGGDVDSLHVTKPTSTLEALIRRLIAGSGLTSSQEEDTVTLSITNNAALAALAAASGGSILVDKVHVSGKTGSTAGGGGAWVAPFAAVVLPLSSGLNVTTPATGVCLLDIGYTATSAATLADTLFDGRDAHTAAAFFEQVSLSTNALVRTGNETPVPFVAASGKWITISAQDGSSDLTGLVADLYVPYYKV